MAEDFEVRWEGDLPGSTASVWDAITVRTSGWYWPIEYEPRLGGAERGLTAAGGTVTAWEPGRRFTTRAQDGEAFNEIDYRLEVKGSDTHLHFTHRGVIDGDYDREFDACQQHTRFYYHSLGVYLRHFAGRDAVYVTADGPEVSAEDGFVTVCRALGLTDDVAVGDRVTLTPAGPAPVTGTVDYRSDRFLGVRTDGGLYRVYGRDVWGWPVGLAVHDFGDGVDAQAWSTWLTTLFVAERVA